MVETIVVGGGVGGLTAAQELVERDVDVTVFEANERPGGKARSMPIAEGPLAGLHGEHGFRFFPAYYSHVIETMERIPDGEAAVADNLVTTDATLIASIEEADRIATTDQPETPREWIQTLQPAFAEDLPRRDVRFLLERLLYLATACEARREDLDEISWWEFIDADNRSQEFRDRLAYAVQSLVALRPQQGSARTIGTIYLQLLLGQIDPTQPAEQVLNAPTSEAWIDPWVRYLREQDCRIKTATAVEELAFDGTRITGVRLSDGSLATADEYVLAVPVEVAPQLLSAELREHAPALGAISRLDTAWMNGIQFYLTADPDLPPGHQVYADAPWALTSVSQRQIWDGFDLDAHGPTEVKGVLSVIASDWDTPGVHHEKPARACTREEVAEEIWIQVTRHLNSEGTRLTDDMLVDWFLDPALVETDNGLTNRSPLLINTVGALKHRPPADVAVPNLTLASDYVRTNSDLASMESANEAGRRAANAILDRHGIGASRATIWELSEPSLFEPFKRQDRIRHRLGLPHPAAVTQSLRSVAGRLRGSA